jgi:hypothetical protein
MKEYLHTLDSNTVVSIKLNSGEEMITRVKEVFNTYIVVSEPVSVAPGPQGMGLVPSVFTANPSGEFVLNTNSIAVICETEYNIKTKYSEAVSGIKVPEKKIILG